MKRSPRSGYAVLLRGMMAAILVTGSVATSAYAAGSIVVNSNTDNTLINLDANATCDLREAIINANALLEEGVVVNTGASVDHDCHLERFCQIWPGAHLAGAVRVGEYSYVGTGASVIQNLNIGKGVMIGAGAAVVSDIPDGVTVAGVPARIILRRGRKRRPCSGFYTERCRSIRAERK